MHEPEMKEELLQAITRFEERAQEYSKTRLSTTEKQTLAQLEQQFATSVISAHQAIALTDQLHELSGRFEVALTEMDRLLDDDIQPIIHAETVRAAEEAMNSSR